MLFRSVSQSRYQWSRPPYLALLPYYEDKEYLSNSRLKQYKQCQARAFAIDSCEWADNRDETPLILGNYVHTYFESPEAHAKFVEEN